MDSDDLITVLLAIFIFGLLLNISNESIFRAMVDIIGIAIASSGIIWIKRKKRKVKAF